MLRSIERAKMSATDAGRDSDSALGSLLLQTAEKTPVPTYLTLAPALVSILCEVAH